MSLRSPISDLHSIIKERPTGEHSHIISFITAVFSNKPPQPMCNLIWEVQMIVGYLEQERPKTKPWQKSFDF